MLRVEDFYAIRWYFFAVGLVILPRAGFADMRYKPTR